MQERYAIEMEALRIDRNHIYFFSSAHPKISLGEIVRIFVLLQVRYSEGIWRSKKGYWVENFGLMDTMLPLLMREGTG